MQNFNYWFSIRSAGALFRWVGGSVLLFLLAACASPSPPAPIVQHGTLDVRHWDFEQAGPLNLSGEWEFYWAQLLDPAALSSPSTHFITLPSVWNGYLLDGRSLPGEGYATYRLQIYRAPSARLALYLPFIETAYRLYVNGQLISAVGEVGTTAATSHPWRLPQVVILPLPPAASPDEILLQVSNFHNAAGGPRRALRLGIESQIYAAHETALAIDLFVVGGLLILAIYHLILFTVRRQDPTTLYLVGICTLSALRAALLGESFLLNLLPETTWGVVTRLILLLPLVNLTLILTFFHALFPHEFARRPIQFFQGTIALYTLAVSVAPTALGFQALPITQLLIVLGIGYTLYALTLVTRQRRVGARPLWIGVGLIVFGAVNDLLNSVFYLTPQPLAPFGVLAFACLQAFLLAQRFATAYARAETLTSELEVRIEQRAAEVAQVNYNLQATLTRTEALYRVSQLLVLNTNLETLLQTATDVVATTLPAHRVSLIVINAETQHVKHFFKGGPGQDQIVEVAYAELAEGLSGWVLREKRPALSPQGQPDPRESPEVQRRRVATQCGAILVVPLLYQENLLGTMTAINRLEERDFDLSDQELLLAIARQLAVGIERKRAERNLYETELRYRTLAEQITAVTYIDFPNSEGASSYISPQIEAMLGYPATEWGRDPLFWHKVIHPEDYQSARAIIATTLTAGRATAEYRMIARDGRRVWVHDESVLIHDEAGQPKWIQGLLIDITERKQTEWMLRQRAEQLTALYQVSQQITVSLDLEEICLAVHRAVGQLMPCEAFYISLVDEPRRELYDLYFYDRGGRWPARRWSLDVAHIVTHVIRTGEALNINAQQARALGAQPSGDGVPTDSILVAPLQFKGRIMGVISAQAYETNMYVAEHLQNLMTLANQVAIAIENTRLLVAERRRANELDSLRATLTVLSGELELSKLLQAVLERAVNLLHAQGGALSIYNMLEQNDLLIVASFNEGKDYTGTRMALGEGLMGVVAVQRAPIILADYSAWSGRSTQYTDSPFRAIMATPLLIGERLVGVLDVHRAEADQPFLPEDLHLLNLFAPQAAVAIENARLYTLGQQELEERKQVEAALRHQRDLFEKLVAVARATVERPTLKATLENALAVAVNITEATTGSLFLLNEAGQIVDGLFARGVVNALEQRQQLFRQVVEKSLAGWVLHHRQAVLISDTLYDERWYQLPDQPYEARSVIGVPILNQKRVLGLLTLLHAAPGHFADWHVHLLEAAADQMALAIRNAQMYEAQRRLTERQVALYGVLSAISGQLDPQAIATTAVELISTLVEWPHVAISILRPGQTHWTFQAASGLLAAEIGYPFPMQQGIVGRVLRTGQTQYVPTVQHDPDYVVGPALGIQSELVVPLQRSGRLLGTLVVESEHLNAFDAEDVALAESLAGALSLALDNAQLYQTLTNEQSRLSALIESARDGVILIGLDRRVLVMNTTALDLLQLSGSVTDWLQQPLAAALSTLRSTAPQAVRALLAEMRRVAQGDEPLHTGDFSVARRMLHWLNLPVMAGDTPLGRLIVLRDVTEERELDKLRQDLTFMMVHDLRNPLGVILVGLEDMAEAVEPEGFHRDMLELARRSAERMMDLVNTILDVSRLETKQMPLDRASTPLLAIVAETIRLQKPLATERKHLIEATLAPDLPLVDIDSKLVMRVLQNLVGNAVKFTPIGGVIQISAQVVGHQPCEVCVAVHNTGSSIPPEIQNKLFEKFVTGRQTGRGSGLGLAFCKLAIEAHGGRIWVESAPDQGATFFFTLPIAE